MFLKTTVTALAGIVFLEALSWFGFMLGAQNFVFIIVCIFVILVFFASSEYGLYIFFAELCIGGKGYLVSYVSGGETYLSLRQAIFIIACSVWMYKTIKNKDYDFFNIKKNSYLVVYGLMLLIICIGVVNGIKNNNGIEIFYDANAWTLFLLLPFIYQTLHSKTQVYTLLLLLTISNIWLSLKTFIVFLAFTYGWAEVGQDTLYRWLRTTGVGEITVIDENVFRIFFQSHIYSVLLVLMIFTFLLTRKYHTKPWSILYGVALYATLLSVLLSQSRSFWIGGAAAALTTALYAFFRSCIGIKNILITFSLLTVMILSQVSLFELITGQSFYRNSRFDTSLRDPASASRIQQLQPLAENIFKRPVFGWGFGKSLSYVSYDPRIAQTRHQSIYATYAFEWGYLDMVLKIGIAGLSMYILFTGFILYRLHTSGSLTALGFSSALVGLLFIHIFTPYLNHPLGIGFIMVLTALTGKDIRILEDIDSVSVA